MILVTAQEMQAMDRQSIEEFGLPGLVLMENAGRGAARFLLEQFPDIQRQQVGVVAGRGNNGGDGFVIARCLSQWGIQVRVYLLARAESVRGDALTNLRFLKPLNLPVVEIPDERSFAAVKSEMEGLDIWVDAILGTGLKSDVKGFFKIIINYINSLEKPVFAVDMPSGINSDTGQSCGACIRAQATATFAYAKTGHKIYPGKEYSGKLKIIDIGIPPHIVAAVGPNQRLISAQLIRSYLLPRAADAHKGSTGHLLVIAGSIGKTGAASMTSMSALRAGAGLVTLGIAASLNAVLESQILEAMTLPLPESRSGILGLSALQAIRYELVGKKCLAMGPGLGQAADTRKLISQLLLENELPVVLDADGINNLAGDIEYLKNAKGPVVITPHPGEMARLLGTGVREIQQDRVSCAREVAVNNGVHVVLKGAATIVAHPDSRVLINDTGNSGMASAGMGDILTGLIAGLIAQGLTPAAACLAGVYLHGAAADQLAKEMGPYGYLASDVMKAIPGEIKKISQLPIRDKGNIIGTVPESR